jgi:hypothetical protein
VLRKSFERPRATRVVRPGFAPRRRRPPAPPLLPRGPGRAAEKETEVDGALALPPKVVADPARGCMPSWRKTNPPTDGPRTVTGSTRRRSIGSRFPASLAANAPQYKRCLSLMSIDGLSIEGNSFSRPASPGPLITGVHGTRHLARAARCLAEDLQVLGVGEDLVAGRPVISRRIPSCSRLAIAVATVGSDTGSRPAIFGMRRTTSVTA